MTRKAFLLGLFSIGSQVLILRELVSTFHSNELLIGTALFGWLTSVAIGAWLGGKAFSKISSTGLFIIGAVTLPLVIAAVRLSPLTISDVVGEFVPFTTTALISTAAVMPTGLVSGWLFPAITKSGRNTADSIAIVYLYEGIGAFVGGLLILLLVGELLTTFSASLLLGLCVLFSNYLMRKHYTFWHWISMLVILIVITFGIYRITPAIETSLARKTYQSYQVEQSFDTHYSHQVILSLDSTYILLTDNTIEAVYPDISAAEYLLIPPLLYSPEGSSVLYFGRTEFGIAQLAHEFTQLSITAVDPRQALSDVTAKELPGDKSVSRIDDDPLSYLSHQVTHEQYDFIIINIGELDSYKSSRYLTPDFLFTCKHLLSKSGILYLPTSYDTDRYITREAAQVLSTIRNVLRNTFQHVSAWPGNNTLFFASDTALFDVPYDSIQQRIARLRYLPAYVNDYYLWDRFDKLKVERLDSMLQRTDKINSLNKPILSRYQTICRAKASGVDKHIVSVLLEQPTWIVALVIIVIILIISLSKKQETQQFGLFLYFTAGLASLTLELISFYVFQSTAGSLYMEMSLLIGGFMLGLAVGAYYSIQSGSNIQIAPAALVLLLISVVLFLFTYDSISPDTSLLYHSLFLFTVAAATGSLFVGATNRYYQYGQTTNPGSGYACELLGSAIGALFTTTILLPLIGLKWLLIAVICLIIIALIGSVTTSLGSSPRKLVLR